MALPAGWITIDVIGTRLTGDMFVHSAFGNRVARPLRRCANKLGFDRNGELIFRAVAEAELHGTEIPATNGLFVDVHRLTAADGTWVGLIMWVSATPPTPRPVYNAWVLDLATMTSRTSGDDPSLVGDGRRPGEERSIQSLLTWLNPEDTWSVVGLYYDALTGEDGLLIEMDWSLRPHDTQWVHLWSTCRLRVSADSRRTLYGLTLQLVSREIEANIAALIHYSRATLLLVEARFRIPLTSVGRLAPLGEDRTAQIMAQIDLESLADPEDPEGSEQAIRIDGQPFTASIFPLRSARPRHGDPVAIVLLHQHEGAGSSATG
ncbi:hypothetical protein ABZ319_14945 [Nocardia sp. NPDC005978]|uniref:hypothetical protein n=1 Tax=Nocardia sp. NPDC005978 TaxID=3156725 RepID=UPI0033AA0E26